MLSGASYLQTWRPEVLGAGQPVKSFLPIPLVPPRPSAGLTVRGGLQVQSFVLPGWGLFLAAWRPACPGQHGAHSAPGATPQPLPCSASHLSSPDLEKHSRLGVLSPVLYKTLEVGQSWANWFSTLFLQRNAHLHLPFAPLSLKAASFQAKLIPLPHEVTQLWNSF